MTATAPSPLLRRALWLDAAASGATALLLLAGAGLLADLLSLPEVLLRGAALVMLPFIALVCWAATRSRPAPGVVRVIVAMNAAWVVASVVLLVAGWVDPSPLGYAFVIAQAVAVAVFAELQVIGLGRARA